MSPTDHAGASSGVTPKQAPQGDDAFELVTLVNGTASVRCRQSGETFHPVVGPVAEAEALYVRQLRLPERIASQEDEFVVWDVGLGSGANALTLIRSLGHGPTPLRLVSFDKTLEPLRFGLGHAQALGFYSGLEAQTQQIVDTGASAFSWKGHPVQWDVRLADFPTLLAAGASRTLPKPHAILYDAYSPRRNPEMWTLPVFERVRMLLAEDRPCALATYSRSTLLRVTLLLAGFWVGSGARTGEKEETTVASNRRELAGSLLDRKWLERVRRSTSAAPLRTPEYRQAGLSQGDCAILEAQPQFRNLD